MKKRKERDLRVWRRGVYGGVERRGKVEGGLPCSDSWFCGELMAKGVGDEEGEVE